MHTLETLVGRTVNNIRMSNDYLVFETDAGPFAFTVYGDCCSRSYFYDFLGVRRLLDNGPILDTYFKDEMPAPDDEDSGRGECVVAYGVVFVTLDRSFGEVTSLMSFRNDSNGYYGGSMEPCAVPQLDELDDLKELTEDCLGLIGSRT